MNMAVTADTSTTLWYRDRSDLEEQLTTGLQRQTARTQNISQEDERLPEVFCTERQGWSTGAVDLSLVKATCLSHGTAFIFASIMLSLGLVFSAGTDLELASLHWTGSDGGAVYSLLDWNMTPWRIIEGILATVPLVAIGTIMEHSEHRAVSHVHFSMVNTVIGLFGRRRKDSSVGMQSTFGISTTSTMPHVMFFSGVIAMVSAISEEMIFRGLLPTLLFFLTHSVGLALFGQALLFGLGQVRLKSPIMENGCFCILQVINSLWYGSVYLMTEGDIFPVLLAHVLYNCHIFAGTWKTINDQMDYTEIASSRRLPLREEMELEQIKQEIGGSLSIEAFQFCRKFFYAFDSEHQGSLSLTDVKRAVAYAFLQDGIQPSDRKATEAFQQMIELRHSEETEKRMNMPEFLRLLFALRSKMWKSQLA